MFLSKKTFLLELDLFLKNSSNRKDGGNRVSVRVAAFLCRFRRKKLKDKRVIAVFKRKNREKRQKKSGNLSKRYVDGNISLPRCAGTSYQG